MRSRALFTTLLGKFWHDEEGSIVQVFAFSLVPMIGLMGAAVDYSRASDNRAKLQAAIDGATLAGAEDGSAQWQVVAGDTFKALYKPKGEAVPTPQFTSSSNQYAGTAATSTTTSLLTPFGYKAIEISAAAKALTNPGQSETSCILTLGQGQALAAETMTFSGSPNVSLAGCNLRSNESMKCNGHDTGALASMSAGTTTNCIDLTRRKLVARFAPASVEDVHGLWRELD
jgi:Flp pilus assembly protein TadG